MAGTAATTRPATMAAAAVAVLDPDGDPVRYRPGARSVPNRL